MWKPDTKTDWSGQFEEDEYHVQLDNGEITTGYTTVKRIISRVGDAAWSIVDVDNPKFIGIALSYVDEKGHHYLDVVAPSTENYFATYISKDCEVIQKYKKYYRGAGFQFQAIVAYVKGHRILC